MFEGCLNWSYFIDDGLDRHSDTETPVAPAPKKASKKGLKKSSLKGLKASKKKVNEAT